MLLSTSAKPDAGCSSPREGGGEPMAIVSSGKTSWHGILGCGTWHVDVEIEPHCRGLRQLWMFVACNHAMHILPAAKA